MNNYILIQTKKVIIISLLAILPTSLFSQSIFDQFEDMDNVSTVVVSQYAFKLMSDIGEESDPEYLNLIKNLKSLKVFSTEDLSIRDKMGSAVKEYLKTSNLKNLMHTNDGDNVVDIYVKEGSDSQHVKELLMFVKSKHENTENAIISLTGNIDLKQVSKLTTKMHIPGGDSLKKIPQNNI